MNSKSLKHKSKACEYDPARAAKSLTMLVAFIFGNLLPAQVYASPSVPTEITAHASSRGTNIQRNGNVYDVTTTQIHKNAGVNHFNKYNVRAGDLVNMHIPTDKGALVNFIHGGRSDIHGIVNAMKNGKIGGDIYFANTDGIVIGKGGVINAGSIHLSTPSKQFMNDALNTSGANIDLLLSNTFSISPSGLVQVEGKLSATVKASIKAGKVILSGADIQSGEVAREDIQINYGDIVNVESMESAQSIGVGDDGVIELFGANGVEVKSNSKVIAKGKRNGGTVAIESGADVDIEDSAIEVNASESGKAGDINIAAKTNIHLKYGTTLSAAGDGESSDGGNVVVFADEETYFEAGAKVIVDAGISGDAGFGEVSAIKSVFLNGGQFSGNAANGLAGQFLIDPDELLINTDIIQSDGSSIRLEAHSSVTVQDALLFSGQFLTGDIDSIRADSAYTLALDVGSITIQAPNITVQDAQLVSGGDIRLDANYSSAHLQSLASISPLQIPNIVSIITIDGAELHGAEVDIQAGISWGGLAFGEDFEAPDDFDWSSISQYFAAQTADFINELFVLPVDIAVVDLDSSITISNNSAIVANNALSITSETELELSLGAESVRNIPFSLIVGVVDNDSEISIENSDLTSLTGEISLTSSVATTFEGSASTATSAGESAGAKLGAISILVTDIDSNSNIEIDKTSTGSVLSAATNISIESEVSAETEVSVEAESGAGGPMGVGVLVNNESAGSTMELGGEYKVGDGADLTISSLIDANHSAETAVSVATSEFEDDSVEDSSNVESFAEGGLSAMLRGFIGDEALGETTGNDGDVTETSFAITGGVSVINLTRNGQVVFNGNVTSQTGADINDVSIQSILSSFDDDDEEVGVGIQAQVTSDADAQGDGENEGAVAAAVAFQTLNLNDDISVIIGEAAEISVQADSLDLSSRILYTDPNEKFFEQSKETIASIEGYFDNPASPGNDIGEFLIADDGLQSVLGLYFDSQEFLDENASKQAAALQEFVFDYIHDEIKSGFTTHVAGTAKGAETLGIAASISLFNSTSRANVDVNALNFLGGADSTTLTTGNTSRFNHSVMPVMTQIFELLKTEMADFNEVLTSAPSGGVGFSWLEESYDLASKVEISEAQLNSQSLDIISNQTTDLLSIVATGGSAGKIGIAGSVINQRYSTDTGALISAAINGTVDVDTDDVFNDFSLAGAVITGGNVIGASVINQDIDRLAVSEYKPTTASDADNLTNVNIDTSATGDQKSVAVAGAISTKSGSVLALAASFTHIDTDNVVRSAIENLNAEDLTNVDLAASDATEYSQIAGAVAINVSGTAGFGGASSSGVFENRIESSLMNVDFGIAGGTGDSISLAASDYTTNSQLSLAAAAGQTVGISGSVNNLIIGNDSGAGVLTSIENSTIVGFDTLSLSAEDQMQGGGVKETSFITGGIAIGGKAGIGASVSVYDANKSIKSLISGSDINLGISLNSNATRNEEVSAIVIAGGVGGVAGIAGAVSVYNANNEVSAQIAGSNIEAQTLTSRALNKSNTEVFNAAVGAGGKAGIAGSVVVNNLNDTTQSTFTGSGTMEVSGDTNVSATLDQTTDFDVASVGIGGGAGVAGSVVVNTINNSTVVEIESDYSITNSGNVSLEALSEYTRMGFVGAVAGGSVGVGAVVTIDDIQNTTNAIFAASDVTITGALDVQANSTNVFDLLALNISGGGVAIGATVNIVNFGGDITDATGRLEGDNLAEYNEVMTAYNISADSGNTSAAIESNEITAASIDLLSNQDNDISLESGGFAVGGAAIGVGVGVVDVKSVVESRIAGGGDYNLSGSDGLNVSSRVDTDAEVFSYAGTVGANAAINVRVSDYSSTAVARTLIGENTSIDLQDSGAAVVEAEVIEKSNVENISVAASLGLAASGAYVATTHNANSLVAISNDARLTNSTTTEITSNVLFDELKAEALGISVGVAAGGILFSEVNIDGSNAVISTGSGSEISGRSVTMVSDLTTEEISSDVLAVSVGLGALSLSDAYVRVGDASGASMTLGGNISATGNLEINSLYSNDAVLDADAEGASGGIVGVSAARARINNNGSSNITFGTGADLSGSRVVINSSAQLKQTATASVVAGGAVGIGGVLSQINSNGQSHITLAGTITGNEVDIDSFVSDVSVIDNSAGAGGVGALTAGGVFNTNIMEATVIANEQLSVDALSFDLTAETGADFDARLEMSSYGLLAGAAGAVINNITQNSTVDLSAGVRYLNDNDIDTSTASIEALNTTAKREAQGNSYQNTLAGLGGFSIGSTSTTHTSNADVIMGAFETADHVDLTIRAFNDTDITDTVKFDSYLLAGGSDSRSTINSTNNTEVRFLLGDGYVNTLTADAYSDVDLTSTVKAVVSGLIAVDVTSLNAAISSGSDRITMATGAEFLADGLVSLSAGIGGDVTISNKSYSYNKSILPTIPDADVHSNGSRNGNITIATGAEIRAGGDITISATHNDLNVSGYALGHSIALEVLDDFVQGTVGWLLDALGLPSSIKYEDEVRSSLVNNGSSVNIDGTIQSGLYNYYAVKFGADSGNTEESITTFPMPTGVNAEYFQEIDYSLLADKFSAAGEAAESLAQLELIIAEFKIQSLGSDEASNPGTYQKTYDALLQQKIFLTQIVANGLSSTEFGQIQIADLNLTNGNVYINAPVVSGSGSVEVLKEARVVIDNRSKHAVKIGNIDVRFKNGGKVVVNGLTKAGSFGGVSISNLTMADAHTGSHNPGISILGNTQINTVAANGPVILNAPPILLDGRISYLGGNINITNERGSIIGSRNMVIEGANVRLAAGKDIILGLDSQAVLGAYTVDQRQGEAISNAINQGLSSVAISNFTNTLTGAKFEELKAAYAELLGTQSTTSTTTATTENVKRLLTLLTDETWETSIDNYSTYLVTEAQRLSEKLQAIDESKVAFAGVRNVIATELITVNDPDVDESDVWAAAKATATTQINNLTDVDSDAKAQILSDINEATTLNEFKDWFAGSAITDVFVETDANGNRTNITKTIGYSYDMKDEAELQATIARTKVQPLADQVIIQGHESQLTGYTANIENFKDAVSSVFGDEDTLNSTGLVRETLTAATNLTSVSATVAGENIFISASAVNLNGHLQAGFDTREITIDDQILEGIIRTTTTNPFAYTTGISVDGVTNKLVYNQLVPRVDDVVDNEAYFVVDGVDVQWNDAEQRIEVGAVEIKGGNITIAGQLFNTGEGNINVMSGYGKVVIDNQTDADIHVGDITNDYVSGTVTLIDSSQSIGNAAQFKKTEYYRELNSSSDQVQLVKNVYTKSGSDGNFELIDAESSIDLVDTRQGTFNPRENLIYKYQNFNLSAEDNDLLDNYTKLTIGGEEVSVVYDFLPVLSVDANVYNQIGAANNPGEFNIGSYSTYGSIQLTDGGDNIPRVEGINTVEFYQTLTPQENWFYLIGDTGWYDAGPGSTLLTGLVSTNTTLNSSILSGNTMDYPKLRDVIDGTTPVTALGFNYPIYDARTNGAKAYTPARDYGILEYRAEISLYTLTTTYQQFLFSQAKLDFSHDEAVLRASNAVNINFMGYDRGEVAINSGGSISVGNIANQVGDTIISSTNGGISHRENNTVHSDNITATAGGGSIGSTADMLNLYQDNNALQLLNVSATENVYVKSADGALEFDSVSNGVDSELVLIAEDDLRVKNHNEANKLEARNIYLESKSGELFGSNYIFIDTKSEDGGVILAKSDVGDIKLTETAGDLAVEKIQASGNVEITVRDGGLTDAQPAEERDEDTISELLALWNDLGLEQGTQQAIDRINSQYEQIQEQRKSEYEEHWEQREVVATTYESNLGEDFQYELTDGEQEFFEDYPDRTVAVNGAEVTLEEYTRLGKQAEYELGYSIKGGTYDADFVGATVAETKAYQFYWNLPGNKSTQIAYVAYDENYVYLLSTEEIRYYDGDIDAQQAYVEEKTQYYKDGASLIIGDKSTASYDANYELVDEDLRADIEAKMTWSKDELTGFALNFAYKETTDTVLEVEESNIFAGGNVTINANFVGINNGETVLVETDGSGNATTNELFKEMVVGDANGDDVTVNRATEVAKLALLSAERNDIVIDNGQDGNNARLSVLQREDFNIDAIGEVSIDTTGNADDASEHVYLGSEKDTTLRRITSAGDVILKSANNVIAAANQAGSHIVYGDVLVLESANGYIGGETPASGEFFKIETSRATITDAEKIGLSARADGSILIQNTVAEQDLWIRDIYSRNGTVALDANGSILDRDNFDYGGDSDSINIGASRVKLTSRNGSVGDATEFGQIELNGDTVLLAQAATGVFVDGEDTLYLEGIINTVGGDITLTSTGDVEFNKLITPDGDINITAQVISSYAVDPFDSNIMRDPAVITTTDENRVQLWALGASSTGISVDLDLGAQRGDFEIAGIEKVLINSASTNAFNISTILSDTGAVDISQVGNLNIGTVGTPTELMIQTAAGDVDIGTIGGDFSLPPGQIRTPQSVRIAALANGSSISVETLNVAEGLDLQAGSINLGSVDSKDGSVISMDVSGNDGGRADYFEISATENTPLLFTQLFAENFAITTGNDLVTILNGDLGNIGTIASTLYDMEVSAVFQPLGIYDYQVYTATNSFDLNLNGANLYSGNYASYIGYDYIFNGAYRTDESALSLMEMLNALSEINYFYQLENIEEGTDKKKEKANQKDELFEPHVEPKELSKL